MDNKMHTIKNSFTGKDDFWMEYKSIKEAMKANELRIGNWYYEFGIPKQVTPNVILKLYQIELADKIAIDMSPIALTSEILEKCAFIEHTGYNGFVKNRLRVVVKGGLGSLAYLIEEDSSIGHYIPNEFKHLHQLQNLYHALTGEELTYFP